MKSRQSYILLIFFLFSSFVSFGQTVEDYQRGYRNGFKDGYCKNIPQCTSPYLLTSNIPSPGVNERNYQAGYARGNADGGKRKVADENRSKTNIDTRDPILLNQPEARQPQPVNTNTKKSRSRNTIYRENRGAGFMVNYDVGLSYGMDIFADSWMIGFYYGSRVLEDNDDTFATEEKIYGTYGLKLTNFMYLKGGIGTYYSSMDDYSDWSPSTLYPTYEDIGRYYDDIYAQYDNPGELYLQIGIQFYIHTNNGAITPEIFYSNAGGTVGAGFGIVF